MIVKPPRHFYIYLALLAVAIAAYWQVAFLQNSLKWDMLDCYLPWRYHVGECIRQGILPLWNPYTNAGYPIYADLRSVWYPETLIVGLTTGYSNLTIHLLFILHISLAGLGFYRLSSKVAVHWKASFLAAAAYMMSGFFVGHGQEMFGIIAATWIPWVLFYFISFLQLQQIADAIKTVLFAFLLISGGYQAMWAILMYLMLVLFIRYLITFIRLGNSVAVKRMLIYGGGMVIALVLTFAVIAVSFAQVTPYLSRLSGVSLSDAWFMPFSPRSALSFLVPFSTVKDAAWFDTDMSMNNAYIGLIMLIFAGVGALKNRKALLGIFLVFGLIALLASFGKYTPVREILYRFVPLMNLFRHSSFFSYFAVLALLLSAASGLSGFLFNPGGYLRYVSSMTGFIALMLTGLAVWSYYSLASPELSFFAPVSDLASFLNRSGRYEHIFIQACIQMVFLLAFMPALLQLQKARINLIGIVVLLEMVAAVQMNIYYTVVSAGVKPLELYGFIKRMPEGFPVPDTQTAVSANTANQASFSVLWRNTTIYTKQVSFEGFNSFRLKNYETLADSFADQAAKAIQHPVVCFSDTVASLQTAHDSIKITGFYPGLAKALVDVHHKRTLTLLQAWYPGWEVRVDGKKSNIALANRLFMSVNVPEGKHEVEFKYRNNAILLAFFASAITLLTLISVLIFLMPGFDKRKKVLLLALLWLMVSGSIMLRYSPFKSYTRARADNYARMARQASQQDFAILNCDDPGLMKQLIAGAGVKGQYFICNLNRHEDLSHFTAWADTSKAARATEVAMVSSLSSIDIPAVQAQLWRFWPEIRSESSRRFGNVRYVAASHELQGFNSRYSVEQAVEGWSRDAASLDSAHSHSGRFSNRIGNGSNGSFVYKWQCTSDTALATYRGKVNVLAKVYLWGNCDGASLFIQHRRDNKVIETSAVSLTPFSSPSASWTAVPVTGTFGFKGDGIDEIVVFIWGDGNRMFYTDDFSVDIRKQETWLR